MKIYPDVRARFALQLGVDMVVLSWVIVWISASATDLSDSLSDAGSVLDDVPVVGDGVATPFDKASEASASMADAADAGGAGDAGDAGEAAEKVAFWLGLTVAVLAILHVAPRYLTGRVRWIREASAGQRVLDGPANLEVFALRAITNQPLSRLARITDDPLGALRRGDVAVVSAMARLEVDAAGLAAPALGVAGSTP